MDPSSQVQAPSSSSPPAATRVLVVDDERDFRDSMCLLLSLAGFRASQAADGYDALRQLDAADPAGVPDVILLDWRMPGMGGAEVVAALRARGVRSRIVLVSAVADAPEVAARHGLDGAVPKPCDLDELVAVIRRCVASPAR